jgi:hypothetical protein
MTWSLQRLRVGSGQFDAQSEEYCVQLLGERFLGIICEREGTYQQCDPKTLATILRSGVMMFSGKSIATNAMLDAALHLIIGARGDDDCADTELDMDSFSSFLLGSNEYEVSNFLFAFAKARRFDEGEWLHLSISCLVRPLTFDILFLFTRYLYAVNSSDARSRFDRKLHCHFCQSSNVVLRISIAVKYRRFILV